MVEGTDKSAFYAHLIIEQSYDMSFLTWSSLWKLKSLVGFSSLTDYLTNRKQHVVDRAECHPSIHLSFYLVYPRPPC